MTLQNRLFSSHDLGESLDFKNNNNMNNSQTSNVMDINKIKSDYQESELNNLKLQQRI